MSDLSSPDPARPDQQFGAPPSGSLERRLSPRHSTSTKVTFAVSGTEPHWAGIVCDASTTGLLLCCEPHPEVRVGASIVVEDPHGRWAEGRVVRTVAHDHHALIYYGVAITAVSHEMSAQFPLAPVERRERALDDLAHHVLD